LVEITLGKIKLQAFVLKMRKLRYVQMQATLNKYQQLIEHLTLWS